MTDVLVIDSSTSKVSVSAGSSTADSCSKSIDQQSSHSENILSCVDKVLHARSVSMSSISAIGVGIGPGLFTGLRVGISAAHAFAHALNVPLVYFSSLELSAMSSFDFKNTQAREIFVAKDARRSELYFAKYSVVRIGTSEVLVDESTFASNMRRIQEEILISPQDFVEEVNKSQDSIIVLDDKEKYKEFAKIEKQTFDQIVPAQIEVKDAIDLVIDSVMSGVTNSVFAPKALYIRKSDAELSWGVHS